MKSSNFFFNLHFVLNSDFSVELLCHKNESKTFETLFFVGGY